MEKEAGRSEKQEEVAERKPAEEEAGPSEKQEEVADRKPVEDQEAGPSTATPEKGCFDFDVFISFRGKDTRKAFTSHLHKELTTHGITAFIDSEDLEKGGKISVLFERIEGSKIFVPVFSQNYADSTWCLKEIAKMVEIYKREGKRRPIIPIFYHVDRSNVRLCIGSFGEAFENHQQDKELGEEEINEWKTALTEAEKISGYNLSKDERTTEAEIITDISNQVSHILSKIPFDIQPVGIDCCIDTLKQMLEKEKDSVLMIGICGMGGIGKTTLAMALYNKLFLIFESSCFFSDIREHEKRKCLPSLEDKLKNEVFGGNTTAGNRFGSKKFLLILDDVDHIDQLENFKAKLGEKEKWFGVGSRIIVTTRDKKVLLQLGLQEDDIYFLEGLNREDSLQLFCHHAFDNHQPLVGFHELSREVVDVAQGLPLALKVFGSLFYGLKKKQEWEEKLKKLKRDQHKKVHERLKISYDGLIDHEKCVFLDIACFFIGKKKEYPVYMWEACGYFPNDTLKVLQYKSLIKVNQNDEFEMHDQIRDMGRMIVKEEGNFDPLKYSRLWSKSQVLEVLVDAEVSMWIPDIQGIDFQKVWGEVIETSWNVIEEMQSLRMIVGANYDRCFVDKEEIIRFPRNLRWFNWDNCPYETLAFYNDQHEKICVLDLTRGRFQYFRSHSIAFPNLKVLDLSWCLRLKRAPDFTLFPSLEKLVLDECCSLTKMDESIVHLKKLVKLSMVGCKKLIGLPIGLHKLASLESLVLSGCKQISVLPRQIGDLSSLKFLGLSETSISAVPDSIGSLQSLEKLDLTRCVWLEKVPDSICGLESLSELSLQYCEVLKQLPNSMGMLTSLKGLKIDYCKSLREVPDSLANLNNDLQISLKGCNLLEKLPKSTRMSANYSLQFVGLKRLPDSVKPVEEKTGPSTATPHQHQLKRKKPFEESEENREQIKRRRMPVKKKERPSTARHFDVFISFRGEDTRNGFTSHLHERLTTHGITAFIDSEDLDKGEKISVLFKHIEWSNIFLPVFSQNYADSKWCLREITKMVEIYKREGKRRPIIPIFYHVDPSNVRHCRGSFGKAFKNHQQDKKLGEEEINEWKAALKVAGELSGYCVSKTEGNEAEIITCIRKRVSDILCKVPLDIQPVGIISQIQTLKQMLEREKDGNCMIGVCGLGGIGKTTLAMALYNELAPTFEGSCFLSDIRSKCQNRDGLPTLQAEFINEILGQEIKKIVMFEGVSMIKQLLGARKVLLILDDVDHKEQLEAFIANRRKKLKWFGEGSKIIVTTRDKRVLIQHGLQERDIYFPEGLDIEHSMQLFCHHAFVRDQPLVGFEELSLEVLKVAQGLPLALKVFGSLFSDLEEKEEWEEMLERLKCDQDKETHVRLRISYDSLNQNQQSVFLDIACFFIGQKKEYPVYMWEACGYFPKLALEVLQHKSLIKINWLDRYEMHDQIRDMGRMIVKEEANCDPLKYSRPWSEDQMLEVLRDAKVSQGNRYVEGFHFNKDSNEKIDWRVIEKMPSLRMITGADGRFHCLEEDTEQTIRLPRDIRWLEWKSCPYQMLTFYNNRHEKLGVLDLSESSFRDFRSHRMEFPKLKILNLSYCYRLIRTPDFTNLGSLEVLGFDGCESLTQMDESIGQLEKLVHLSLQGCEKLKGLPARIGDLTSLKYLSLERTSISDVPDSIGRLQNLEKLILSYCSSLKRMPDSIGGLKSLSQLYLNNCESLKQLPNSMGMLRSLEELRIDHCKLLREVPDSLGDLNDDLKISLEGCISLEKLPNSIRPIHAELIFNGFKSLRRLPDSMNRNWIVTVLSLLDCESLEELPNYIGRWASSLCHLELSGCTLLRTIPESIGNLKNLERLRLSDCQLLKEMPECVGRLLTLKELDLSGWISIKSIPEFIGNLERLKHLSLQGCQSLEKLPECTCRLLSLEELDLSDCTLLRTIPKSIGNLESLNCLRLSGCTSLISVPESIGYLKRLKLLNLQECRSLKELPESMEGLQCLKVLHICGGMSVKKVPDFIGKLMNLEQLYLREIEEIPDSIGMLPVLKELHLSSFNPLNCQLPKSMEGLKSLTMLCVCGGTPVNKVPVFQNLWRPNKMVISELEEIPEPVAGFSNINAIVIADCPKLESLPQLPSSVTGIWIQGCAAFKKLSDPSTLNDLSALAELHLSECKAFTDLSGLLSLKSLQLLALADWDGLSRDLMDKLSQASFESLFDLLIWGASDGSGLLFGLPKSNFGKVCQLQGRCFLTEELPSNTLDINICIQVLVEGKVVTEVTCTARRRREEKNDVYDEYYNTNDIDDIDDYYDTDALERWRLEGRDFYSINYNEGEEIVEWVEEGNAMLRVLTTYNHYRLRMAFLAVQYW